MNKLSFEIFSCSESNDHEIRILVDGEDYLGSESLGLDPPSFFSQDNIDKNGLLMIGRCSCGCVGCCDVDVTVQVEDDVIIWTDIDGLILKFDKSKYLNTFKIAKNDFSWEDINRKVERLTKNILENSISKNGYKFDWASARIKPKTITLSYSKNGEQNLYEYPWDGQNENDIESKAKFFLDNDLR